MKEKSGLPDSHEMKNEDIRDAMLQDENMLKNQNLEQTRHIKTLESDRLSLMKQLRSNVYQMG